MINRNMIKSQMHKVEKQIDELVLFANDNLGHIELLEENNMDALNIIIDSFRKDKGSLTLMMDNLRIMVQSRDSMKEKIEEELLALSKQLTNYTENVSSFEMPKLANPVNRK